MYARICFSTSKQVVKIDLYNYEGACIDSSAYENVKLVEISGVTRIDISSMGMGKDIICIFAENVNKWKMLGGVLKVE
ncbi:hypothetical protein QPL79_00250 [Ignisphaera sp. 4213-co]|uniref:STAS domain-containing protein n=1 Tax=Ignisphaera cupida TaxID=3050454 RepID=A0ABD4Z3U6_9CREN|nr:hypothetical protein [Ignisphaera sp. 4213-co]MDK6027804.1 hypothetical protein [Ignisphaera sp. 4213-co]